MTSISWRLERAGWQGKLAGYFLLCCLYDFAVVVKDVSVFVAQQVRKALTLAFEKTVGWGKASAKALREAWRWLTGSGFVRSAIRLIEWFRGTTDRFVIQPGAVAVRFLARLWLSVPLDVVLLLALGTVTFAIVGFVVWNSAPLLRTLPYFEITLSIIVISAVLTSLYYAVHAVVIVVRVVLFVTRHLGDWCAWSWNAISRLVSAIIDHVVDGLEMTRDYFRRVTPDLLRKIKSIRLLPKMPIVLETSGHGIFRAPNRPVAGPLEQTSGRTIATFKLFDFSKRTLLQLFSVSLLSFGVLTVFSLFNFAGREWSLFSIGGDASAKVEKVVVPAAALPPRSSEVSSAQRPVSTAPQSAGIDAPRSGSSAGASPVSGQQPATQGAVPKAIPTGPLPVQFTAAQSGAAASKSLLSEDVYWRANSALELERDDGVSPFAVHLAVTDLCKSEAVLIVGIASSSGSAPLNFELSRKRAQMLAFVLEQDVNACGRSIPIVMASFGDAITMSSGRSGRGLYAFGLAEGSRAKSTKDLSSFVLASMRQHVDRNAHMKDSIEPTFCLHNYATARIRGALLSAEHRCWPARGSVALPTVRPSSLL
jgi:hypothetical protein